MSLFPAHGPSLPPFRSLLIKGEYHPSAPIHLCLSQAARPSTKKVLLLTPSRRALATALKQLKDEWIQLHGGEGEVADAALKVDVLYPPTPSHLMVALSMFHEALVGEDDLLHPKVTFSEPPSLIVLCDLSSYFASEPATIVSSYLVLVSRALASVSSLSDRSGACTSLAVFDSGLDALRLPLLRSASPAQDLGEEEAPPTTSMRRESLGFLAQRYFEWVGTVTEHQDPEGNPDLDPEISDSDVKRICSLQLQRTQTDSTDIVLKWTERAANDRTRFTFPPADEV